MEEMEEGVRLEREEEGQGRDLLMRESKTLRSCLYVTGSIHQTQFNSVKDAV